MAWGKRSGPSVTAKVRRTRTEAYGTPAEWYALVAAVAKRDGDRCRDCGSTVGPFHTHHSIPVARGGKTVMFNLKRICLRCHNRKPGHRHMRKSSFLLE